MKHCSHAAYVLLISRTPLNVKRYKIMTIWSVFGIIFVKIILGKSIKKQCHYIVIINMLFF